MRKFFLKGFSRLELIPVLATSVHLHLSASALLTNTPLSYFTIQCGTVIVHLNNGKGLRGVCNKLASLEATLVRNYDPLTHSLTHRGKV